MDDNAPTSRRGWRVAAWFATSRLVALVCLSALVITALMWTAVESLVRHERDSRMAEVKRANSNLARVLEEHTIRSLSAVEELSLLIKERFEREGERFDVTGLFAATQVPKALVRNAVITDQSGFVVLGSHGAPRTYLGDREHIKVHAASDSRRLFVGKPVLARVNGKWSIVVTRRANKPDGSLLGVVAIAIDPFYFSDLYKDVDLGSQGTVALLGNDGVIRARLGPGNDRAIGADVSKGALFQHMQDSSQGTYEAVAQTDGVPRIFAFRAVQGYPLYVTVGTSFQESMAPVFEHQRTYRLFAAAGTLLLLVGTWALTGQIRRRDLAEAAAQRYRAQLERDLILLDKAKVDAEAGSRAKSTFLATMSHEVRTPLNGIMGMLHLLAHSELNPKQARHAALAIGSAQTLLRLLNDMLDFSAIEAGRLALELTDCDPRPLVSEVAALYVDAAIAKGLDLRVDVSGCAPCIVRADAHRLRQVLANLLSNAMKFTTDGSIAIRLATVPTIGEQTRPCRVRIEVVDTGIGIAKEQLHKVFVPFSQVDGSITRRYGGTGLGLAICKDLVAKMNGQMGVSSALGKGSTFWLELDTAAHDRASTDPVVEGSGAH